MKRITKLRELKKLVHGSLNSEIGLFIIENQWILDGLPVIDRQRISAIIAEGENTCGFADPHACAYLGAVARGIIG